MLPTIILIALIYELLTFREPQQKPSASVLTEDAKNPTAPADSQ